ncbi:NADP-dependent phosphogluconate dehydrogenase [Ilyomonas limi]|uniref:6-phosphogluconate dehydrogenase, decarboxylating n=1 Tax=Ilyomonas limi TaxID=2575867 RepID=A0A4U3KVM4_9BACT|nr:NADP-dependent phosphogluconate dehydrogenase [Ilyomonas limi]TKK66402.1 NADP-dependent phosphogluconate dehydrogenase [Ilyomonas limi]
MGQNIQYDFGMIGLGVMGSNLLLNMAGHQFAVIGFDKDVQKGQALEAASSDVSEVIKGVSTLEEMVRSLKKPRKMMMLVPAGKAVDSVIESLLPLIEQGDVVIDGGNSHYTDTLRRVTYLKPKGIHFMGMGISGGEHGARTGPSMMPGGNMEAYNQVKPILEAVAAKVDGEPCTAYMGKDAAGHYVKMVHNGIEYAMMQLISEVYDLMKRGLGLNNDELHDIFGRWNGGELQSYLIDITEDIFVQKDDQKEDNNVRLIDLILDKAGSKGTGKWTSQDAMDLPVAVPTIDTAVSFRTISGYKDERVEAAKLYKNEIKKVSLDKDTFINQLEDALYFGFIICYAQGLAMLYQASKQLGMDIPLHDVVKIWRGGCIIRSKLLNDFYKAFKENDNELPNILLDKGIADIIKSKEDSIRTVIKEAIDTNIALGGLTSALAYFDAYTTENMPTNLIQAQRDYFGAHTYQRIDMPGVFHTGWISKEEKSV